MNKVKNAYSWLVSQLKAGISRLKDTWPVIQAKAEKMANPVYEVAISHVRKVVVCFNRGMVTAIETAERRQAMPFHQAFAGARAVVKAMTDRSSFTKPWEEVDRPTLNLDRLACQLSAPPTLRNNKEECLHLIDSFLALLALVSLCQPTEKRRFGAILLDIPELV